MIRIIIFALYCITFTACSSRHTIPQEGDTIKESTTVVSTEKKHSTTVVIDPGHGGRDPGASSHDNLHFEKHLNLATALMVRNHLDKMGYTTLLTRDSNKTVSLHQRALFANENKADLFVSIHFNAAHNSKARGIEIYHYAESSPSKRFSNSVLPVLLRYTKAPSRGTKPAYFIVLQETTMPAILVEGGFMTNSADMRNLQKPRYLNIVAYGIAKGIDEYVSSVLQK